MVAVYVAAIRWCLFIDDVTQITLVIIVTSSCCDLVDHVSHVVIIIVIELTSNKPRRYLSFVDLSRVRPTCSVELLLLLLWRTISTLTFTSCRIVD